MDPAAVEQVVENGLVRLKSARTTEDALSVAEQMMGLRKQSSISPEMRLLVATPAKEPLQYLRPLDIRVAKRAIGRSR